MIRIGTPQIHSKSRSILFVLEHCYFYCGINDYCLNDLSYSDVGHN